MSAHLTGPASEGVVTPRPRGRPAAGRTEGRTGAARAGAARGALAAVLFDRDGTLVEDVPYNGDPDRVRLLPGARQAVDLLRAAGVATGVVSNQSGIGRGLITDADVRRCNERADALLGGLGTWVYCPHLPEDGCDCRKPRPGLVREAARRLEVPPEQCVVIGDIAADVLAAEAAGARGVLVAGAATRPEEVAAAPRTASDLLTAVRELLAEARGHGA
ncbi:HAD-IIIA family hydrolase [Streptomyces sp. NK08204]|uniref:D-glycero-alpha-D-manno-heptose-1,7-bisphosphate 7-phosphatase n=1 Tax=Streptomyces sp. NK08204 TaxID=2873260 RepID=UPI001CEC0217|nr:HAD-IIIA family hydrolase [Streptomyces sp. NK08204]